MELWWITAKLLVTPNLGSTFLSKYQHFFLFASLKSKCLCQTKLQFLEKTPALVKCNFSQLSVRNHSTGPRSSSFSDTDTIAIVLQCLLSLCARRCFDLTLEGPDTCCTKQQQQLQKKKKSRG